MDRAAFCEAVCSKDVDGDCDELQAIGEVLIAENYAFGLHFIE